MTTRYCTCNLLDKRERLTRRNGHQRGGGGGVSRPCAPLPQCSKRPNPLKLTLVGISRFSGALVGPSRGSRHMTSVLSFHM